MGINCKKWETEKTKNEKKLKCWRKRCIRWENVEKNKKLPQNCKKSFKKRDSVEGAILRTVHQPNFIKSAGAVDLKPLHT